jgi:hypothetical protein
VVVAQTYDGFGRETDETGPIKDPAERYQVFMLGLYDMLAPILETTPTHRKLVRCWIKLA